MNNFKKKLYKDNKKNTYMALFGNIESTIDKQILSNNMINFIEITSRYSYDNGYMAFDYNNIELSQHKFLYDAIKNFLDKSEIQIDDYNIIIRSSTKLDNQYYDFSSGYGERYKIVGPDEETIDLLPNFEIIMFFNKLYEDDIIYIYTDLKNTNIELKPEINKITIRIPDNSSISAAQHGGFFFRKDKKDLEIYDLTEKKLFFINIALIHKSYGKSDYSPLSGFIKNKNNLYNMEDAIVDVNMVDENVQSCSENFYIKDILENMNYSFERLYKTMYPGVYSEENCELLNYNPIYENIEPVNNHLNPNSIEGFHNFPPLTKKIFNILIDYMIKSNKSIMTITK
jgi:hypothetical protein